MGQPKINKGGAVRPYSRANPKYPFSAMEAGDSVLFEGITKQEATKVSTAAYRHATYHGKRFSVVTEDMGLRVSRIA